MWLEPRACTEHQALPPCLSFRPADTPDALRALGVCTWDRGRVLAVICQALNFSVDRRVLGRP